MGKIQCEMKSDFTMVHNYFLKDKRLGLAERGLLMTMLYKPAGYRFTIRGLAAEVSDGVASVTTAMNHLKKFGYVKEKRTIIKGKFGPMDYDYSDEPIFKTEFNDPKVDNPNRRDYSDIIKSYAENPCTENPNMEKPNTENLYDYISTDKVRTERIKTKEIKKEKAKPSAKSVKQKTQYAESVYMTEKEYQTLLEKHDKAFVDRCIEVLNNYKLSSGRHYNSDYHAILSWVEKKVMEDISKEKSKQPVPVQVPIQTDPHENPFTKYLNESGGKQ